MLPCLLQGRIWVEPQKRDNGALAKTTYQKRFDSPRRRHEEPRPTTTAMAPFNFVLINTIWGSTITASKHQPRRIACVSTPHSLNWKPSIGSPLGGRFRGFPSGLDSTAYRLGKMAWKRHRNRSESDPSGCVRVWRRQGWLSSPCPMCGSFFDSINQSKTLGKEGTRKSGVDCAS